MKLLIEADYNDADYVIKVKNIEQEELEKISPVIKEIVKFTKNNPKHTENWPDDERSDTTREQIYPTLTKEQIEYFNDNYCPHVGDGDCQIHTIKTIELIKESQIVL